MASKATEIYRRHSEYYDEEMRQVLAKREDALDYPAAQVTNDIESSKAISQAPRPYMIVASNGMLTGGRVVNHLRELVDDPTATLLFVGYQGQGTLGAQLQAGVTPVRIDGEMRDVRCQIRSISGFSAHADESELLDWIGEFKKPRLKRVFIVHGDPEAQAAIEPKIRALGFDTHIPKWHERVTLD
jgi:metallo-beta-lactamase family protein